MSSFRYTAVIILFFLNITWSSPSPRSKDHSVDLILYWTVPGDKLQLSVIWFNLEYLLQYMICIGDTSVTKSATFADIHISKNLFPLFISFCQHISEINTALYRRWLLYFLTFKSSALKCFTLQLKVSIKSKGCSVSETQDSLQHLLRTSKCIWHWFKTLAGKLIVNIV